MRGRVLVGALMTTLVALAMFAPLGASAAPATKWLCKPGLKSNPCMSSLKTTSRDAAGKDTTLDVKAAKKPKVDCFYVYPTVSGQQTDNANLAIDPEQIAIAQQQASRFSQVCRMYAPVYRQITLKGISGNSLPPAAVKIAYSDVKNAWLDYLKNYNHGRGVILIGHSQGAGMLSELVAKQIDPHPSIRHKLVSAMLLGGNVEVPIGKDVGGSFKHVPACRAKKQIDCVVAYSMFDSQPPEDALFGRVGGAFGSGDPSKSEVLCTDPTKLTGSKTGVLEPFIRTEDFPGTLGLVLPPHPVAPTPWVTYPNLYKAHCAHQQGADWLQVDYTPGANDVRPQFTQTLGPTWGLHLGDINLAVGNLVKVAAIQAQEYLIESVAE